MVMSRIMFQKELVQWTRGKQTNFRLNNYRQRVSNELAIHPNLKPIIANLYSKPVEYSTIVLSPYYQLTQIYIRKLS